MVMWYNMVPDAQLAEQIQWLVRELHGTSIRGNKMRENMGKRGIMVVER